MPRPPPRVAPATSATLPASGLLMPGMRLRALVGQAVVEAGALGERPRVLRDAGELARQLRELLLVVLARRVRQLGDQGERLRDAVDEARPLLGEVLGRLEVVQAVQVWAVLLRRLLEQVPDGVAPLLVRRRLLEFLLPLARDVLDLLLAVR